MEKDILRDIGLSGNEAEIYLSLLKIGPALVSQIVDKTRINRTNIYDRLSRLISKGLIAYVIKSNRKYFYAASPKNLLRYLEEREEKLQNQKKSINQLIPELEKIRLQNDESVEVYEGKEGLKTILEDIIQSKKDILTYGSEGNFSKILSYYFAHYLKRLEKNKIKMKVIFNYDDTKMPFKWKFAEARYLDKKYKTPTETTIYGDKIVIFILTEQPKAVLIKSKVIAESYNQYFNLLWRAGKKA